MPSRELRKEAVRKFKEQKPLLGAYAVRCIVTGNVWVGVSKNLDATKNGSWFSLRNGSHIEKSLQAEWNAHGEQSFTYEILAVLDEDVHAMEVDDLLKAQKKQWMTQCGARPLP
jgi:hypothetical protein